MDQLIDIIFDNPFFIIIIIGGLISLFKGKAKQEEQQEQRQQQQPQQQSQQARRMPERPKPTIAKQTNDHRRTHSEKQEAISNLSIEEHRAEQMKRFSDSLATNQHSGMTDRPKIADATREEEVQRLTSKYNDQKFKRQFENSLTNKGLINSVVMAEVLGSPRARRSYQTVITKRRSN